MNFELAQTLDLLLFRGIITTDEAREIARRVFDSDSLLRGVLNGVVLEEETAVV